MAMGENDLLRGVAAALADNRGASMGEIAVAAGTSRATLHRRFPTRDDLAVAVAHHALDECDRIFDVTGMDDRPVDEVLEGLSREVLPLAVAYELLWAVPPITDRTDMKAEADDRDDRFERFAVRAQAAGRLRADVPARWIVYSVGSQALALWYAVRAGFVGSREAERLFRTTVLDGLGTRDRAATAGAAGGAAGAGAARAAVRGAGAAGAAARGAAAGGVASTGAAAAARAADTAAGPARSAADDDHSGGGAR